MISLIDLLTPWCLEVGFSQIYPSIYIYIYISFLLKMLSLTYSKIDKDATVHVASGINAWAWTFEWTVGVKSYLSSLVSRKLWKESLSCSTSSTGLHHIVIWRRKSVQSLCKGVSTKRSTQQPLEQFWWHIWKA